MFRTLFLVAVGGAAGSVLRYLTSFLVHKFYPNAFPWATLLTNILGCFLIGLFIGQLQKHQMADSPLKWLLVTGFCGGYTTFSAFGYENLSLFQSGHNLQAMLYISASLIMGIGAVWLGLFISQ